MNGFAWQTGGGISITATPQNITLPVISGDLGYGNTLTCSPGTWAVIGDATFAYQWQRDGVDISGATSATYQQVVADGGGKTITCDVSVTDDVGTVEASSAGVGPTYDILLSDDFSSYADTGEMIAGGWVQAAGTILLNAERLELDAAAANAQAARQINGFSDGDALKITYDNITTASTGVEIRTAPTGSVLASGSGGVGTFNSFTYTVSGDVALYFVARRNQTAADTFIDNVVVEVTNP